MLRVSSPSSWKTRILKTSVGSTHTDLSQLHVPALCEIPAPSKEPAVGVATPTVWPGCGAGAITLSLVTCLAALGL